MVSLYRSAQYSSPEEHRSATGSIRTPKPRNVHGNVALRTAAQEPGGTPVPPNVGRSDVSPLQIGPLVKKLLLSPEFRHGGVVWICKAENFRTFASAPGFRTFAPKIAKFRAFVRAHAPPHDSPRTRLSCTHTQERVTPRVTHTARTLLWEV